MKNKINVRRVVKISIFYLLFLLFITNHSSIRVLSNRIEHEILKPYLKRDGISHDEIDYISPTPLTSNGDNRSNIVVVEKNAWVPFSSPTPTPVNISEEELWNALTTYRKAHNKSNIQLSESLCVYARERASELAERLVGNPENPLDNHEGFKADADSGYVFNVTGFNYVGENLAFVPGYTTATQVIEWGWDSSVGHRSLQLSDDITHGCISGIYPIFVGIYAY